MWFILALTIKQAFPCLNRVTDDKRGQATEIKIAQSIESAGLCLVGWYHSHPLSPPTPTVQDIDSQLEYQLKLKGTGDQGYRPCVAMISCNEIFLAIICITYIITCSLYFFIQRRFITWNLANQRRPVTWRATGCLLLPNLDHLNLDVLWPCNTMLCMTPPSRMT